MRKLDEQFGRIERALRYAPRPYQISLMEEPRRLTLEEIDARHPG